MFMLYDDDNYSGDEKKKSNITKKILKWAVYLLIAFIYIFFMSKIFISCENPSESKILLFDDNSISAYYAVGEDDFVLYNIKIRDNFGDGDAFFVSNIIYLESSEQLQFTMRYKKNRLDSYNSVYEMQDYKQFTGNFMSKGYLLAIFDFTLQISAVGPDLSDSDAGVFIINQDYYTYQFETNNYYYHRVNFNNIKIDYKKTKLELFVTLGGGDADVQKLILAGAFVTSGVNKTNIAKIAEGDYFTRFTLFDVNTPKEKVKLNKFETKTINTYNP